MVKNSPDEKMPELYKTIKKAVDDQATVEERVRAMIRNVLREQGREEGPTSTDDQSFRAIAKEMFGDETQIQAARRLFKRAEEKLKLVGSIDPSELKELILNAQDEYIKVLQRLEAVPADLTKVVAKKYVMALQQTGELTPADVRLLRDHPKHVLDLPYFKEEFLPIYISNGKLTPAGIKLLLDQPDDLLTVSDFQEFFDKYIMSLAQEKQDQEAGSETPGKPASTSMGKVASVVYTSKPNNPHIRVKGQAFAPMKKPTRFKKGDKPYRAVDPDGKLRVWSGDDVDNSQEWDPIDG
jgi:hypothetical protein